MQSAIKLYLHAGFEKKRDAGLVFRVSFLGELWLIVIGCNHLPVTKVTNEEPPRPGQTVTFPRGIFRKPVKK